MAAPAFTRMMVRSVIGSQSHGPAAKVASRPKNALAGVGNVFYDPFKFGGSCLSHDDCCSRSAGVCRDSEWMDCWGKRIHAALAFGTTHSIRLQCRDAGACLPYH